MKKLMMVLFVAFFATLQVSNAQNPVLNVYISGPETTAVYDIYIQIVNENDSVIAGPTSLAYNYCFGLLGTLIMTDQTFSGLSVPFVNPSPRKYCKIQIGVSINGTTYPPVAAGASEFMSYDEITTSAKPVKIRF